MDNRWTIDGQSMDNKRRQNEGRTKAERRKDGGITENERRMNAGSPTQPSSHSAHVRVEVTAAKYA